MTDNLGKGFSGARASFQPSILKTKNNGLLKIMVMRIGVNNGIAGSHPKKQGLGDPVFFVSWPVSG
jgi:hypothetical protein